MKEEKKMTQAGLEIRPVTLRQAKEFVAQNQRHHLPPQGHKFSIGLYAGDRMVGCAICGRPVSRIWTITKPARLPGCVQMGRKMPVPCFMAPAVVLQGRWGIKR